MSTHAPVIERPPAGTTYGPLDAERHRRRRDVHCTHCGYGVTMYREMLRCPMCGSTDWAAAESTRA